MPSQKSPRNESDPSYQEAGQQYSPDTCQSLVQAAKAGKITLHALGRAGYPGQRLGELQLPGLRSVGNWNAGPNQTWGLPVHRNEGIEITFLASGQTPIRIQGERRILSHDQFMITRPWQPHQIGDPHIGACKLIWLIIDVGVRRPHQAWKWPDWVVLDRPDLDLLTRYLRQNEQFIWPGGGEFRRCFLSIAQALESQGKEGCISRLAVRINELLLALLEIFKGQEVPLKATLTSAERTVGHFFQELNATLDQPWTLESMAESCHLGVTQFVHYFRTQTNLTPMKFLAHARIQKACEMLLDQPAASITDVAFACGFSSSQYFNNVFRQQTKQSPREYRSLLRLARNQQECSKFAESSISKDCPGQFA